MIDVAIRCEGLAKQYRIGERESYRALRDVITNAFASPFRRVRAALAHSSNGGSGETREKPNIWALKDVSFEIKRGEVVGIIGRNGAGKSTLLKILSRITEPTQGSADIWGRIGSLLEVGTGFHPELTGRDNIFLNGAILGMKKTEITRKFDEIVAFAELEKFIDTPVKRYSSGMYMRLAFSVAAHLDSEILLVDEVLAVGDASFQKKCVGKMNQVSGEGRTILFVSHNMAAIKALCRRAILLDSGVIASSGAVTDVIEHYFLSIAPQVSAREWRDPAVAPGNENVRLAYIRIIPPENEAAITIDTGVQIEIGVDNLLENINLGCTVYLNNHDGVLIFESGHVISSNRDSRRGLYHLKGRVPAHLLNAGRYSLDVLFGKEQRYPLFRIDQIASFEVENTATGRDSNMSVAPGVIRPMLSWSHSLTEESSVVRRG